MFTLHQFTCFRVGGLNTKITARTLSKITFTIQTENGIFIQADLNSIVIRKHLYFSLRKIDPMPLQMTCYDPLIKNTHTQKPTS